MKPWMMLAVISSLVVCSVCDVQAATDDDDEYEEVVVRRKKGNATKADTVEKESLVITPVATTVVSPAVVTVPITVPTTMALPVAADVDEEPPPPPEPPATDAAEPRRLVRYFCKAWKDKDYERLWWAMSESYRKKVSLKKFKKLFVSDAETNGGLLDENILETAKTRNGDEGVKVELIFKFPKAKHRFVMAVAERQTGGMFRLVDSPLIPLDIDDL